MAKNVLFLLHGVGRHQEGWATAEDGPVPTLTKVAEHYDDFTTENPLGNSIEFVEIRYDDIFDKILQRWATLADGLENLPEATPSAITEVRDKIAAGDEPDNWFAAQALDVTFYIGFRLVRRLVQLRVASQIMKTVASHDVSDDRRYGIMAHSLGTAIAHDAIHRMGTSSWLNNAERALEALSNADVGGSATLEDIERARRRYGDRLFAPDKFKFEAIFMISNTSRLLHQEGRNPFESIVRPSFSGGGPSKNACLKFFNIDHVFDPVSKVRKFRAHEAWPRAFMARTAHDISDLSHIHDINVHSLQHYIEHPYVHDAILRSMVPHRFSHEDSIIARQRVEPGGDFLQWGEKYRDEDLQEDILNALEALRLRGNHEKLSQILAAFPGLIADIRGRIR